VYLLGRYLEFVAPEVSRLSLAPILGDIRESMLAEVDFSREAHHLTTFSDFLDSAGLRGVATAPYVYRQYSSTRWVMQRGGGGGRPGLHACLAWLLPTQQHAD
jgi:aarF domain-containing kinase